MEIATDKGGFFLLFQTFSKLRSEE